jgi:hypothetical protein
MLFNWAPNFVVYLKTLHRRRDKDLVETHGPRIKAVQKIFKKIGLSNETSLEKIYRDLFLVRFYT